MWVNLRTKDILEDSRDESIKCLNNIISLGAGYRKSLKNGHVWILQESDIKRAEQTLINIDLEITAHDVISCNERSSEQGRQRLRKKPRDN
jgi:hypothetical protein